MRPKKPRAIHYNERQAKDAFAVHKALIRAELAEPSLRTNPAWIIHRQDAYEHFSLAFQPGEFVK